MSYILDALKKSEEQRKKEHTSSLHRPQASMLPALREESRFGRWPVLLLVFVCLSGGYLLFRFLDFPHATVSVTETDKQAGSPQQHDKGKKEPETVVELRPQGKKVAIASADMTADDVLEPRPLVLQEPPSALPEESPALIAPAIPELDQLDTAFRQALPPFKLAGHVYSEDPALRMVLINNSVVREKDIVEKDYVVEEITPDGIIMRLGEVHFRLPVP